LIGEVKIVDFGIAKAESKNRNQQELELSKVNLVT